MDFPIKIMTDDNSYLGVVISPDFNWKKILCIFSCFQFKIVKLILEDDRIFLFSYTNHFTFIRIKFH